ncbi:MAG: hypothetical protein JNL01_02595 [Bdellovibrionales bacterium]|nr:hypothetical protein [Bdellovibrionales bacterium]
MNFSTICFVGTLGCLATSVAFAKGIDPSAQETLSFSFNSGKHCAEVVASGSVEAALKASPFYEVQVRVGNQTSEIFQANDQDLGLNVQSLSKAEIKHVKGISGTAIKQPKKFRKFSFCVDLAQAKLVRDTTLNNDWISIELAAKDGTALRARAKSHALADAALTLDRSKLLVAAPVFTARVRDDSSGGPAQGFTVQLLASTRTSPDVFNSKIIAFRGITDASGVAVLIPYGIARYNSYFTGFDDQDFEQIFSSAEAKSFQWLPIEIEAVYSASAVCGYSVGKSKTKDCRTSSTSFNYDSVDPKVLEQQAGKVTDYTDRIPITVSL